MEYYQQTAREAFAALGSGPDGLSARQAAARLARTGPNELRKAKKESVFQRFLQQMADPMILVLLAAAALSALTAACAGESFADVFIILAVVLINALLGVYQESKAEKAIEALQRMTAAHSRAVRGGRPVTVASRDLVPGDVVLLEAGCAVPADGRVVEAAALKIEEAALTGESVPVEKSAAALPGGRPVPLGDRHCMAYMGSTVSYGRGRLLITATGMDTEMGHIAGVLAATAQGKTPLQQKLAALSRALSVLVLAICVFIFGFGLWQAGSTDLATVLSSFMVAVSLAVAAVPEGLAAVVTIVLSMGVTRMSRQGAVIRRLTAVETLGCAQVICSDKTGTLTQNKMQVQRHWGPEAELARALAQCSDAVQGEGGRAEGEPTECALVEYAAQLGLSRAALAAEPRVAELPFDSARKRMSTFHTHKGKPGVTQYVKGAPDVLLEKCTHWLKNGAAVPLTAADRAAILAENRAMARAALRVLAAARREWPALPADLRPETAERQLTFIGLVGMMDPVRPEAAAAIARCRAAGIRPVMITGDHRDTAAAIGRQLGILQSDSQAVTGAELDRMSDGELTRRAPAFSVYARVQPQHKVRIVRAWKAAGCVTAMTGDGVNDAPALKAADIGVGMGLTGTDVTKNVADMVLTDDNFATIVAAVAEGRRIYDNIRKAVQFLLASNASEVLSIFFATLLGVTLLKPVHLLWINLITDCFPALALGMEKAEPGVMDRPPRRPGESIFAGGLGLDVVWQGLLVTGLTLAAYFAGVRLETGLWQVAQSGTGVSMAFLTMSMAEIFHSFNMRSQRGSVFALPGHNPWLWGAMAGSLALSLGVLAWPPAAAAFGFALLTPAQCGLALGLALAVLPAVELGKALLRAGSR
ncbi:MAG TPA: cation-translocating P-type ATPase [Candidatus Fournierella merdavium]|uniref:cation-translocating P-type ATPase n=1 Tax=Candidatus Allofournierella merdavium TaxID=2838593 RepID=UPI001F966191|nr:cation-translocating P-type ATPase [Candidatus Fournierella merdavium]